MIPDWRSALLTAARAVRPGGRIHVVDFGDLRALWPAAAQALRAWLKLFHVAPRDELLAMLEAGRSCSDARLALLPGRYAFVFKANPGVIMKLAA
jgi:S-adenosylmethionine-diacylgycerolhomoserine-N-methlytransferase